MDKQRVETIFNQMRKLRSEYDMLASEVISMHPTHAGNKVATDRGVGTIISIDVNIVYADTHCMLQLTEVVTFDVPVLNATSRTVKRHHLLAEDWIDGSLKQQSATERRIARREAKRGIVPDPIALAALALAGRLSEKQTKEVLIDSGMFKKTL